MPNNGWVVQHWPMLLVRTGLAMFCLVCVDSWRFPPEAIFVGPAMMVAGVALREMNKAESCGQDSDAGHTASGRFA